MENKHELIEMLEKMLMMLKGETKNPMQDDISEEMMEPDDMAMKKKALMAAMAE